MKKVALKGAATILIFFVTWFILVQVNWMSVFSIENTKKNLDEKLGEKFLYFFKTAGEECKDQYITRIIDSLLTKICIENSIPEDHIKIQVLINDEINAFALPGGYIIINTGLLSASETPEELCGIICHEIAHIELDHVMKKLIKEVGLGILVSMNTGNSSEIAGETARLLSSSAYDRSLETEADMKAVDYLIKTKINPEPFAHFLYNMSDPGNSAPYLTWINTHPDGKERAEKITEYSNTLSNLSNINKQVLEQTTWKNLKERVLHQ